MDEDPDYDDLLLGRPAFAGVESVAGDAVIIRITAKAAPEKQVNVARTIRERMKLAFDRAGIVMPVLVRGLPTMPGQPGQSGQSGTPMRPPT
jgi:small conductance mechanosensitive channel